MTREYLDRPPPGWFVLDVLKKEWRKWDWVALMIDIDFDDFQAGAKYRSASVRIPGKHRSRDSAWKVLEDMMLTRH
jgi:hypothetical protein